MRAEQTHRSNDNAARQGRAARHFPTVK